MPYKTIIELEMRKFYNTLSEKDKDAQFENIAQFKTEYQSSDNPIISIDTKKKEFIGNYYRPGHLYTREEIHTYDF